ncbi:MAG: hypothetical protein AAFO02_01935 [Bacteroidota bacterium]
MSEKKDESVTTAANDKSIWAFVPSLIGILWFLTVVPTYFFHHPYYSQSMGQFQYWGLTGGLAVLFGAAYFFFVKTKSRFSSLRGWKLYLLLLLVMNAIMAWYGISNQLFTAAPVVHLGYFTGFVILTHLAVLYITVLGYVVGTFLLQPFSGRFSPTSSSLIAIALGWSVLGFLMLLLGLMGVLHPVALWALAVVITVLRYRTIGQFLHRLLLRPLAVENIKPHGFLSVAFLLLFIGVNAIGAIKAFPAGFDGAALYLNTTKLIGEYQALPQGGQAYNWSVIMSMGNLLFGSMTVAILLSNLLGVFCLFAIYRLARHFVSISNALLAATIFYTLPAITFHSYFDEKVDLGLLFVSLSTLLLLFEYFFRRQDPGMEAVQKGTFRMGRFQLSQELLLWIFVGWLAGFAFGIKYSALFNILGLGSLLFYRKGGIYAFLGSLLAGLALLFIFGIQRFTGLQLDGVSPLLLGLGLLVPGGFFIGWAFRSSYRKLLQTGTILGVFALAMVVNYAPWMVKHASENKAVNISALIIGKSPKRAIRIKPRFRADRSNQTAPLNTQNRSIGDVGQEAQREELQRYQGFEAGFPRYLSLPYDVTMNTNLPNRSYLDVGFLWLLLLPLLLLAVKPRQLWKNIVWLVVMTVVLLCSIRAVFFYSALQLGPKDYLGQHALWFQNGPGPPWQNVLETLMAVSEGIAPLYNRLAQFSTVESLMALLLLFLLSLWLAFGKRTTWPLSLKTLLAFTSVYLFVWFYFGSAVPWYGFAALAILPILMVYYLEHPEGLFGKSYRRLATGFIGLSFGLCLVLNLFMHFYDASRRDNQEQFYQGPFIQFATQNQTYEDVLKTFNPVYVNALNYLNQNTNERIYRVGTFLNYHIKENDRRVLADNQLAEFSRITSKLSDKNYFLSVLRDQGFRYILYDLNTATLDRTPEKSLTQKNQEFVRMLLDPTATRLLVTDRIVEDLNNILQLPNEQVRGRYGLNGKVISPGSFILFEIL